MVATVRRRDEARRSVMPHLTDQLSAYLDGTLTPEDAAAVASHLAECAECRGTLDDLQAVRNLLHTVPSRAPHPSLLPRTLAGRCGASSRRWRPLPAPHLRLRRCCRSCGPRPRWPIAASKSWSPGMERRGRTRRWCASNTIRPPGRGWTTFPSDRAGAGR